LVRDKVFFSALCDRLGLPSFGSIFFVCGSVVLLAVLCAFCDYLGAMGDSSSTSPMSLSHHAPAQRITSALLNGRNFAAWSRSLRLYLGGKGKSGWLLGIEKQPDASDAKRIQWDMDNCTILGWMFNSMDERIYNTFMYHDTVNGLWTALCQMYAHARNDARIFELYQDVSHASQAALGLSVVDYFGYLQSRWEELAPYEPFSDFPVETASIVVTRLSRQHTY
jgi:hypothetical protein